jgi:hypothetical protein
LSAASYRFIALCQDDSSCVRGVCAVGKALVVTLLETYFELPRVVSVTVDTLGGDHTAMADGVAVTVRIPRMEKSRNWPLLVAPDFVNIVDDDGLSNVLDNLQWGAEATRFDDNEAPIVWVSAVGLTTECEPGKEQAAANRLTEAMDSWWPSVCDWIEIMTRQAHDARGNSLVFGPHHPIWAKPAGEVERLYRQSSGGITIDLNDGPDAQRALNVELFKVALARAAQGPPPTEWLLIRDGRLAHQSGSTRRAVIDFGTAVELALTKLLRDRLPDLEEDVFEQLLTGHRMLGARTALLRKLGGTLPEGTQRKLVEPGNRAAHTGTNPPPTESYSARLIAVEIVEAAYPLASFQ